METTIPIKAGKKWHTVYKEEESELLDGVVCIGNTSLHLELQLCAVTGHI